jgi:tetratricopeptide (TPR) repeat protein
MPEHAPGDAFSKGLDAVARGEFHEALSHFEATLQAQRRSPAIQPGMRALSYYGLCLALSSNRLREARELCETAVEEEFYNPELYLNLGRVYLRSGDRARAFGSFVRGLQLNPRDAALVRQIRRLGVRQPLVIGFLGRGHILNRLLGRLRGRGTLQARRA